MVQLLDIKATLDRLFVVNAVFGTSARLLLPTPAAVTLAIELRVAEDLQFFQDDSWIDTQATPVEF